MSTPTMGTAYPSQTADRKQLRADRHRYHMAYYEQETYRKYRSLKCGDGWHHDPSTDSGCTNDGSSCLCECHDA